MSYEHEALVRGYRAMVTIRQFEVRLHKECLAGKVPGFTHLYEGQEASAAGVMNALRTTDHVASTHRAHGHYIAKGGDLLGLALEIMGKSGGICGGKGGTMHVADWSAGFMGANGIIGASVPHALGASFTARYRETDGVAVSFLGDGASNQGAFLESLNLASVFDLPVLFVLEDNGYAETTASAWAIGGGNPTARAESFGIAAMQADGADFFDVFDKAAAMIEAMRKGGGPRFLHIDVPMFRGHFEGDTETYRPAGEVAEQRRDRDCLKIFRAAVASRVIDDSAFDIIDEEVPAQIDAIFAEALAAPEPDVATLLTNVSLEECA